MFIELILGTHLIYRYWLARWTKKISPPPPFIYLLRQGLNYEALIGLSLSPECWDQRYMSPCLTLKGLKMKTKKMGLGMVVCDFNLSTR